MITTLAPWYGSDRMIASKVGELLVGCEWVGIPCAGGMSAVFHLGARTVLVSDLHRHVLNLAAVVSRERLKDRLVGILDNTPFHPDVLKDAQQRCIEREQQGCKFEPNSPDMYWAQDYFIAAWMSRNGTAGTKGEFRSGLSVRWNAGGGDSAVRFRNATDALNDWLTIMRRCTFVCEDVADFTNRTADRVGHGLYVDIPFPGPGDRYKHTMNERQRAALAALLMSFTETRVVCRFYDVEEVQRLYAEEYGWTWHRLEGRKQTNAAAPEVLLVRN